MKSAIFVGTYEPAIRPGVHVLEFDDTTGSLKHRGSLKGIEKPAFLARHQNKRWLYATGETETGEVWSIDLTDDALKTINHQPSGGASPCHLSIDATGKWLFVANYTGGSIAMYPILENGALGVMSDFVQHTGHSVMPGRQDKPHAHSITIDPSNRFALVADLGLDQVLIYELDLTHGKFTSHGAGHVPTGAGPRHVAFHPSFKWLYVCNELNSTVTQLAWNTVDGSLTAQQSWTSLPATHTGENAIADIHVAPNGTWLATSNRGHQSLAVYSVDASTGVLTPRGNVATGGDWPRNFAIHPSGAWLLAGNQHTNNIGVLTATAAGELALTGTRFDVPSPVCILFA